MDLKSAKELMKMFKTKQIQANLELKLKINLFNNSF